MFVPVIEKLPRTIGEALSADLAAKGMTQEQLGKQLEISQQAISAWIADNRIPHKRLPQLALLFGGNSHVARLMVEQRKRDNAQFSEMRVAHEDDGIRLSIAEPAVPDFRAHTAEAEFRTALPERLRANAAQPRTTVRIGGIAKHFDYVSDKVVLELKSLGSGFKLGARYLDTGLLQLAVARQATQALFPERTYILGVVVPAAHMAEVYHDLALQRIATDASLLGIDLITLNEGRGLAWIVDRIERGLPIDGDLSEPGDPQ